MKNESNWFLKSMKYGFVSLPRDIGKALVFGLLIAGLITALIPEHYLSGSVLGSGIVAMLVMMAIGIPVYVCATASVPVALAFIASGISPGAALVFLMTGPATNAATIAVIWKTMGRKTTLFYLFSVIFMALISGLLLDFIYKQTGITAHPMTHEMLPSWFNPLCAVILIGVLMNALFSKPGSEVKIDAMEKKNAIKIKVKGMTCTHCQSTVRRAIIESPGVEDASVDLSTGDTTIIGDGFDLESIKKKIFDLGYHVIDAE